MSQKLMPGHTCRDSLLKCADCKSQICPKCSVECPVGNRCRDCGKGAGRAKPRTVAFQPKKAGSFLLFGGLYGWLITYLTLSCLNICFGIAFWAAGRETGSQLRRGDKELALSWMLPFLVGMVLGTGLLYLVTGAGESILLMAMNLGILALGLLMGGCGFG